MRNFNCSPYGNQVDLDDPITYKHLPNDIDSLRTKMLSEIGYTYLYLNYWNKGWDECQKTRIEILIESFATNERENFKNVMWYKEQLFIFQNEIENMC